MNDAPDYYGNLADVILRAEWAAREASDKNFYPYGLDLGYGEEEYIVYTVPSGKTLYITNESFAIFAAVAADADSNQIGAIEVYDKTAGTFHGTLGGNGGNSTVFNKPLAFAADHLLWFRVIAFANHDVSIYGSFHGYEK